MAILWVIAREWCERQMMEFVSLSHDGRGFYVLTENGNEKFVSFKKVNV